MRDLALVSRPCPRSLEPAAKMLAVFRRFRPPENLSISNPSGQGPGKVPVRSRSRPGKGPVKRSNMVGQISIYDKFITARFDLFFLTGYLKKNKVVREMTKRHRQLFLEFSPSL